jgi:hypothetical protein
VNVYEFYDRLSEEYERIASRALTPPANTAELMALKSYVAEVEASTVLELEERLRQLCQSMLFLVDHTTVSPAEVKQNAAPFQWYAKMPAVFAEHQDIVQKKTVEYQNALKVSLLGITEMGACNLIRNMFTRYARMHSWTHSPFRSVR